MTKSNTTRFPDDFPGYPFRIISQVSDHFHSFYFTEQPKKIKWKEIRMLFQKGSHPTLVDNVLSHMSGLQWISWKIIRKSSSV